MADENSKSSISQATTYTEMADFWDTHSTADYHDKTYEVDLVFAPQSLRNLVAIEPELMEELRGLAAQRRVSIETLINVWLRAYVDQLHQQSVLAVHE
jgi:hypothetical protein